MATQIKLEILSPCTGFVQSQNLVNGSIQPAGPMQVLVHCPDGKWHIQSETYISRREEADSAYWSVTCSFGDEEAVGGSYDIVAIAGNSIRELIVDSIPDCLPRSRIVHVRRGFPRFFQRQRFCGMNRA